MYDRKTFLIGLLTVSAAILTVAHLQLEPVARADTAVANEDFQLVTGKTIKDEDALYILSKSRNMVAIFAWDNAKRSMVVRDVKSMDAVMNSQ